jgi:hypothetical protein
MDVKFDLMAGVFDQVGEKHDIVMKSVDKNDK